MTDAETEATQQETVNSTAMDALPNSALRSSRRGFWVFVLLALIAGGSWWLMRANDPLQPIPEATHTPNNATADTNDTAVTLEALKQRIADQETRIAALEKAKTMPQAVAPTSPSVTGTENVKVQDLLGLQRDIEHQAAQLHSLGKQAKSNGVPLRQLQLWVLLHEAEKSMNEGRALGGIVAQLQEGWLGESAAESTALRMLSENTETPLPTLETLQQDFSSLRGEITASILRRDVGFMYRLKAMLRNQIRVKRMDDKADASENNDPLHALDDMSDALKAGDIRTPLHALHELQTGKAAFSAWATQAQRRLNVEDALDALRAALIEQLMDTPSNDEMGGLIEPEAAISPAAAESAAAPTSQTE